MNDPTELNEKRHLFEGQLPEPLNVALRVAGCQHKEWRLSVPGSKSLTNRVLVLGALAGQPIEVRAPLLADDTWWGLLALHQLGFAVDVSRLPQSITLTPPRQGGSGKTSKGTDAVEEPLAQGALTLHVGQAGTLGRFLPALLLNWKTVYPNSALQRFQMTGHDQLAQRPLVPLIQALRELGGDIQSSGQSALPVSVRASRLAGACRIDGSQSGQFLSGALIAAAGSRNECHISRFNGLVQPDYVRMTLQMLKSFGAHIDADDALTQFKIHPRAWTPPRAFTIEADASTACYYAALACVFGIDLHVENIGRSTTQPDIEFVSILQKFGFTTELREQNFSVYGTRGRKALIQSLQLDMSRCSDQALTVGVMAIVTGVHVVVRGIAHVRHHESDRIGAFCLNCNALRIAVEERPDGFVVHNTSQAGNIQGDWPTHRDHRFALSGIVLAAWARGVRVLDPLCMQKTAPAFVAHLQHLGVQFTS